MRFRVRMNWFPFAFFIGMFPIAMFVADARIRGSVPPDWGVGITMLVAGLVLLIQAFHWAPFTCWVTVTDVKVVVRRGVLRWSFKWADVDSIDLAPTTHSWVPHLHQTRKDGAHRMPIPADLPSPPEADWWGEVCRQADAHGVSRPDDEVEPWTRLDVNLKTGQITAE